MVGRARQSSEWYPVEHMLCAWREDVRVTHELVASHEYQSFKARSTRALYQSGHTETFKSDTKRCPRVAEDRQRTPSVHLREQEVEDLGDESGILEERRSIVR